jgi:hypothetical protein
VYGTGRKSPADTQRAVGYLAVGPGEAFPPLVRSQSPADINFIAHPFPGCRRQREASAPAA